MKLFVFLTLVASSIAYEAPQDLQKANDAQQYIGYAVDLEQQASLANFQCLKNVRYTYAFVGVYNPYGNGSVYLHAASNLVNAWNAGLNIYPTLSPAPNSFKSGAQQFDEAYWNLYSHNLIVNTIWLKVSSPITWPNNPYRNVAFLSDILNAAARVNVAVGIYTNWNDWAQITGNWALTGRQLWYWNTNGVGHDASGSNDFTDFRSFAGFTEANGAMKQYTIGLQGCGVTFNRNRYVYTVAKEAPFGQGINFHQ